MTKIQVFIDFEAITQPFSKELKLDNDFPYAYTIGIKRGKQFKTKTSILNFNHVSEEDVFQFIRVDIIEKIHALIKLKGFKINKETIEFVGWAPNLEKKILAKSFEGIEVKDLAKGASISLSNLTNANFNNKKYFSTIRKDMTKSLKPDFITRRGLDQDGAIASLAGYLLFSDARNLSGKFSVDTNIGSLIKDLLEYSKDDVLRMHFLNSNPKIFNERKKALEEINKEKSILAKKKSRLKSFLNNLENYDADSKVSDVTTLIKKELIKLDKKKKKLNS